MSYKFLFRKPIKDPNKRQPWYTRWSKGNLNSLIFNIYLDTIFVGGVFGFLLSILVPDIFQNSLFVLSILLSPVPLIIISTWYYKNVYNYNTSVAQYGLKPSFKFIIPYQFLLCLFLLIIFII